MTVRNKKRAVQFFVPRMKNWTARLVFRSDALLRHAAIKTDRR
jgi:hypothetical protein